MSGIQEEKKARLRTVLDGFRTDPVFPVMGFSAAVIKGGELAFEYCGGYRQYDAEDPKGCLPMQTTSRYRIASISKMFVAVAIMQLVEQGKLSLDDDASDHLGFVLRNPQYPDRVITPRLLLSHYGSIRDGSGYSFPPEIPISEAFLPEGRYYNGGEHFDLRREGKDYGPGQYYVYSNLNYGLLGTIVERLSGERFDRYMRKHVLKPMGIDASFNVGDFDQKQIGNLAAIYKRYADGVWSVDRPWTAQIDEYRGLCQDPDRTQICNPDMGMEELLLVDMQEYAIGTNATVFSPQGGLRISAKELTLFIQMIFGEGISVTGQRILQPSSVKELLTPVWVYDPTLVNCDIVEDNRAYGPGINIVSDRIGGDHMVKGVEGITMHGHTGSAYGLVAACYFDPVKKNGFAYAFNGLGSDGGTTHGSYSCRCPWHERMMTAIYKECFLD